MVTLLTHGAYWSVVILLTLVIARGFQSHTEHVTVTLFILGVLGTWRYSWVVINFTRAAIFHWIVYPRRKARAFARFRALGRRAHAFFLVTSYMVDTETTIECYRALFNAAARARDGATIVASVVDGADERLIRSMFDNSREDMLRVKLVIDRIKANGKRDALAQTLKIIASQAPTRHDIIVFVDGDTMMPEDVVAQSAPMFVNDNLGALTTDEGVVIARKNLFHDWFILRFNQRQVMMCSMACRTGC